MTEPTEQDRDGELVTKLAGLVHHHHGALPPKYTLALIRDHIQAEREELRRYKKALERLAAEHECGCRPCRGQCQSHASLLDEVDEKREIARQALKGTSDE